VPGASTPAACAAAACAAGADAWQLCAAFPADCTAPCFVGPAASCGGASARFGAGGARAPRPPPPFDASPAQPGYDDAAWDVVDAPHDALIATPFAGSAANGEASIPRNVSWYRKRLALPADWAGGASHVSVYVEGAFATTRAFFNGAPVMNHSHGYTSFAVRLDNASGAVFGGGENVLALFVDATETTGWWCVPLLRRPFPPEAEADGPARGGRGPPSAAPPLAAARQWSDAHTSLPAPSLPPLPPRPPPHGSGTRAAACTGGASSCARTSCACRTTGSLRARTSRPLPRGRAGPRPPTASWPPARPLRRA